MWIIWRVTSKSFCKKILKGGNRVFRSNHASWKQIEYPHEKLAPPPCAVGRLRIFVQVCPFQLCWGSISFLLMQFFVKSLSGWYLFQILILFQELELQQAESGFASPHDFSLPPWLGSSKEYGKMVKLFKKNRFFPCAPSPSANAYPFLSSLCHSFFFYQL